MRVFQLPVKMIDERTEVETEDVWTCQPDYDASSVGTTMVKFAKLPTVFQASPVAIKIGLSRQTNELTIATNAHEV
jgi:hypothetical protein